MNSTKRKRSINQLFHERFHSARFFWRSSEERAWENMAPVGREFGSPDYDRLMQQDHENFMSNLSSLFDECSDSCQDSEDPSDPDERKDAVNVQIALHELGQDVSVAVAAAVWRHHSNSLMAGWMLGAETVASAKQSIWAYCMRNPTDFVNARDLRIASLGSRLTEPWRVVEVQVAAELILQVRFADGVQGTVKFEPTYLTGAFAVLKDPAFFNQARLEISVVTWPGELDLAPDAMYDEIKAHGECVLR
ncbi:DUF2442 domain-containing protein [Rhodoferax ferrireducens]|uniref:DUF2442 domain-containing protein n=1 Tax=Rhodoferax ferrireducens TaxID=192843 RepID=UPI001E5E0CB5|nr:DUF2442 domain-containing protein [Rhodoferax ferrireducens]